MITFGWLKTRPLLVAPLRAVGIKSLAAQILSEEIRAFVGRSRKYTLVTPEEMAAVDAELARHREGHQSGGQARQPTK